MVFINSVKDIQTFTDILMCFGCVARLSTSMQKSQMAAIKCENIDLDSILEGVPAVRAHFRVKYLGLPLLVGRMCKSS